MNTTKIRLVLRTLPFIRIFKQEYSPSSSYEGMSAARYGSVDSQNKQDYTCKLSDCPVLYCLYQQISNPSSSRLKGAET